jgi:hypothetical protein
LEISGFRQSNDEVAAFHFSSPNTRSSIIDMAFFAIEFPDKNPYYKNVYKNIQNKVEPVPGSFQTDGSEMKKEINK